MIIQKNRDTPHNKVTKQIHTQYNGHIREYDNDCIERQFYKYLNNIRYDITYYSTETITETICIAFFIPRIGESRGIGASLTLLRGKNVVDYIGNH